MNSDNNEKKVLVNQKTGHEICIRLGYKPDNLIITELVPDNQAFLVEKGECKQAIVKPMMLGIDLATGKDWTVFKDNK